MSLRERYGPWAVVAGASEGTGRSFARALAAQGVATLLIANGGPLEETAEGIRRDFGVECRTARGSTTSPSATGSTWSASTS